jgi:sigma-B regulation protein RsbU (phosphoserine phosphatase)
MKNIVSKTRKSKILIVDDSAINLKLLIRTLNHPDYQLISASNGKEAWKRTVAEKPDLILLDIMMPIKNGFEVCQLIKKNEHTKDIPVIFLTAKNESVDKIHGLALGAVDYITKPFDPVEVKARVDTHLHLRQLHQELLRKNDQLKKAFRELSHINETINKDIKAAGYVQRQLLPQNLSQIGPFNFTWNFIPSSHVAGDFFNVIQIDKSHFALFIIDVSGHGVQSAMLAISIYNFFHSGFNQIGIPKHIKRSHPLYFMLNPQKVAETLNNIFSMEKFDAYFTCIYALVNIKTLETQLVNAGHPFPIIIHKNNTSEFVEHADIPVGMLEQVSYSVTSFTMQPGDKFVLYTDGLYEFPCREKPLPDSKTVAQFLTETNGKLSKRFENAIEKMRSLSSESMFRDDVSLFGIEVE